MISVGGELGCYGQKKIRTPRIDAMAAEGTRFTHHYTGAMGKWGLGPVGSTGDPNQQGFDRFFGYNCQVFAASKAACWKAGFACR